MSCIGFEDVRKTRHCCHVVNLANRETAVWSSALLRQLSQQAALETLSRYFDAARDSDVASVQVRQIF